MRRPSAFVAGVGHTEFSQQSGRLERELAIEAVVAAVEDAGLSLSDIDGLVTYENDVNDPMSLANELGLGDLHWFSCTPYGGGLTCGGVQEAALAIDAGLASAVVAYRAANMRSGFRFGQGEGGNPRERQYLDWTRCVGLEVPAHVAGIWIQRYLHERQLTNDDLAPVVLASRRYAKTNPRSRFYLQSFSLADYLASPWVLEPALRVADCCLETDGGAAVVVTDRDRGHDGSGRVTIRAAARGMCRGSRILQSYYRPKTTDFPDLRVVLDQLWSQAGIGAADLDVAVVYDAFSPFVLVALEELGLVEPSEVAAFVAEGETGIDGNLPINPHGGLIGEAYIHGFNGLIEAVAQARGSAANQVRDVEHVLVTGGPALPTSGLILAPA